MNKLASFSIPLLLTVVATASAQPGFTPEEPGCGGGNRIADCEVVRDNLPRASGQEPPNCLILCEPARERTPTGYEANGLAYVLVERCEPRRTLGRSATDGRGPKPSLAASDPLLHPREDLRCTFDSCCF